MIKKKFRGIIDKALILFILLFLVSIFIVQPFEVEGISMENNFYEGDCLFVNKFIYNFKKPQRFDVIVFGSETKPSTRYIKRVIGLPEEVIFIREGKIFINGIPLREEKIIKEKMNMDLVYFPPTKIPKGHVFVMGDNRNNSLDSVELGPINIKTIIGKVFIRYWSSRNTATHFLIRK
ncbi:MAG: signal peptidase I [bacterium]